MIGKSKRSKTTIQVNTSAIIPVNFAQGAQYGTQTIVVTPLWGRMVPNGEQALLSEKVGVPSAYMDFGFRRVLTMFTQLRVKGCYIKVTPMMTAAEMDFVQIWSTWERKGKWNDWTMYGAVTSADCARKVKETAQLQGKKGMTLNVNKGSATYATQCVAFGSAEKTGWTDSDTTFFLDDTTAKRFTVFYNRRWFNPEHAATTYVGFNPMCFISFEAPITPIAATSVAFLVEMTTYIQLRFPGCNISDLTIQQLLKLNKDLIPFTPTKKEEEEEEEEKEEEETLM